MQYSVDHATRETLELGSLRDQIRARLEKDILEGALRPGMAIDEKALALSFNASRMPVREALLLPNARGLVEIVPRSTQRGAWAAEGFADLKCARTSSAPTAGWPSRSSS